MAKKYELKIQIHPQRLVDLFISACEGGSNYWCMEVTPLGKRKGRDSAYTSMLDGFTVRTEERPETIIKVSPEKIDKALLLFQKKHPSHFGDFLSALDDAITGDVFLQLCTFGEVIYG